MADEKVNDRAARIKGGTSPRIEVNRDRIAALFALRDEWKQPDEVYADTDAGDALTQDSCHTTFMAGRLGEP